MLLLLLLLLLLRQQHLAFPRACATAATAMGLPEAWHGLDR